MNQLNQTVNQLNQTVNQLQTDLTNFRVEVRDDSNSIKRGMNKNARDEDALFQIRNNAGNISQNFPTTKLDLNELTIADLNALLDFYEVPYANNLNGTDKLRLLKRLIGIIV